MTCGEKNPSTPPAHKGGMNADEIRSNLEALAQELGSTGVDVPVVIVGGALMAFRNLRESSTDIDTVSSISPELRAAIERVATSRHLPKHWLNQSAMAFAPNTLLRGRATCCSEERSTESPRCIKRTAISYEVELKSSTRS